MSSEYIPAKKKRFISKTESKKLLAKLQMKYGADLEEIDRVLKKDIEVYGYVRPETEAKREMILDKIKAEEKHYL